MKVNLRNKLGIVSMQAQEPYLSKALDLGFRHWRIDPSWALCEQEKGKINFDWFKPVVEKIYKRHGTVLASLFTIPHWTDPLQPKIDRWTFPAIGLWKPELHEAYWVNYCERFCREFADVIKTVGVICETNIFRVWRNPDPRLPTVPRSASDYMRLVVKPVMPVFRAHGLKVVVGSPTLRGENYGTFKEALKHIQQMRNANRDVKADFLDCHIYRTLGKDIVKDARRMFAEFQERGKLLKHRIFVTESGINEKECFTAWEKFWRRLAGKEEYTGQMKQERNYKAVLEMLAEDSQRSIEDQDFFRWYAYRLNDSEEQTTDLDGLFYLDANKQAQPKLATHLIGEYLNAP